MINLVRTCGGFLVAMGLVVGCEQHAPSPVDEPVKKAQPEAPTSAADADGPPVQPEEQINPDIAPVAAKSTLPIPSSRKLQWLRTEIARQKTRSQELWAYAGQFDDNYHIGTAFNEINIPEHSCFVLGHLLRRGEQVMHLEVKYETDMTDTSVEGTHAMRVDGHSMTNFVGVAQSTLEKTPEERAEEWNLDCVDQLGIPKSAYISIGTPKSFYDIRNDGKVLQILGDIEPGFHDKVRQALDKNPGVEVVALGSGGGLVSEALKTGSLIRQRKLTTSLWNNCYSACPLVFLGGHKREVWSPYPKLGFHQVYSAGGIAAPLDSPVYTVIASYVREMGADPRYVLLSMWAAAPTQMNYVDTAGGEDLCDRGLTTWVQRGCSAGAIPPTTK